MRYRAVGHRARASALIDGAWVVWGHARVDAQLQFSSTAERASDPLVVALASVARSVGD